MKNPVPDTCVLGGGISGLAFAHMARNSEVFERDSEAGGLCRSLKFNGYTFDQGSHVIFSQNRKVLDFMLSLLGKNVITRRRNARILYKGRYVKYPFENGLGGLPKAEALACASDYLKSSLQRSAGLLKKPANFKEWMVYRFGQAICDKYLYPYNRKIWDFKPEDMDCSWVEGRVPQPPALEVLKSAAGFQSEGYVHQLNFHYPQKGGYQALTDALAKSIGGRLHAGTEIVKIKREGGWIAETSGGDSLEYKNLVSTVHLSELAKIMGMPRHIREAICNLKWNSMALVMLGVKKERLGDIHWLYAPGGDVLPNRISFPSNYSPWVAPKGHSSVLAEVTFNPEGGMAKRSCESIQEETVGQLHSLRIIDRNDLVFAKTVKIPYAYVVYDLEYQSNIKLINDFADEAGITLLGRFSEFRYCNSDKCIESALEKARRFI